MSVEVDERALRLHGVEGLGLAATAVGDPTHRAADRDDAALSGFLAALG